MWVETWANPTTEAALPNEDENRWKLTPEEEKLLESLYDKIERNKEVAQEEKKETKGETQEKSVLKITDDGLFVEERPDGTIISGTVGEEIIDTTSTSALNGGLSDNPE